jgi:hypothetical protein
MTPIQLSDAQAVILSAACAREDGMVFPVTANLKGGAVGNVCKSLLKHGLIEEVPATDRDTVWRHDEARGPITLRTTPLAFATLGIPMRQDVPRGWLCYGPFPGSGSQIMVGEDEQPLAPVGRAASAAVTRPVARR